MVRPLSIPSYTPPVPIPCTACGVEIVHDFGTFDADLYQAGRLHRHICDATLRPPLNEREWAAFVASFAPKRAEPRKRETAPIRKAPPPPPPKIEAKAEQANPYQRRISS